ncbi:peptide ABC transporter permease [Acuticoccus sediminis]|uniref:Peptide ABC transporter permease n=1 Tax=Acuticoccus sediminis TaxID=2184697 RepID=A0A8B2NJC9_9HYPH|nr:dipeptide/oligopeptide/nickel ABC transporter permease/ATP-binding protein [Acuticoccus sediminis]RAH97752.1 peptide ABC transporter permease [Acuticoccus sediminis]
MRARTVRKLALPVALVVLIVGAAALAPVLPLMDPTKIDIPHRFAGPSWAHPLGQDEFGRDELSRIVWGGRASLTVAILSSLVAAAIGTALGLMGGYFRGLAELFTVRAAEVLLCLPPLLLALLVVTLLGSGATTLVIALSILYTPRFVRVAYAATLQTRNLEFVMAQEALGRHPVPILARTLLPNIAPPLLVQLSVTVASAMVIESGLSFLGLGVVPPAPSWGLMIRGARAAMDTAPMLLVWPCLALVLAIFSFNLLCDRLRDVLDPRAAAEGTVSWLRARRAPVPAAAPVGSDLARLDHLTVSIGGKADATRLVRDVSFAVKPGETLALVGESGSGKTLSGLAMMGLLPPGLVARGAVPIATDAGAADALALPEDELRRLRGRDVAMVFQDASASLSPVMRVGEQIAESIGAHATVDRREASRRAEALLARVGMPDPRRAARAWPHELSGGQRQRAMIAAALANGPKLLIADEPTTALDPTIQAQILALLKELKDDTQGMAMVFVTHNLAIVSEIADRVVVLYAGELVEAGPVAAVFGAPRHPYTAALLNCVPESGADRLLAIPGVVPAPDELPEGCRFAPRCGHATDPCHRRHPDLDRSGDGHDVRCLKWRELA